MEHLTLMLLSYLYEHQKKAIEEQNKYKKCLINMWCGTGKTRTFTIDIFINNEKTNVIVFPSLGLINQYCNDYALSTQEPFKTEFVKRPDEWGSDGPPDPEPNPKHDIIVDTFPELADRLGVEL